MDCTKSKYYGHDVPDRQGMTLLEMSKWRARENSFRRRLFDLAYRVCEWAVCRDYKYDNETGTYRRKAS